LLNSRELKLRIRRSSRRKSPSDAGSLIVVSEEHKFALCMATRMFKYKYEYKYFKTVLEYKNKYQCR